MLRPDRYAARLHHISLDELAADGVRGMIVDLDNTLVGYSETELAAEHLAWVAEARARGFALVMLSNNFTERVRAIGDRLGIPTVPNALKPLPVGFARAMTLLGTPKEQTVVVGDQLFTDVLGAKAFGLRAILTEPLVPRDFAGTWLLRVLERIALRGVPRREPPRLRADAEERGEERAAG